MFHLLDEADVFITNNRLKSLVRSGLDYESLKDRFPKLIYGLVTGYGQTGPDVDAPGYDGVAFFSRSGMLADMAEPSGYPASAPGCIELQELRFLAVSVQRFLTGCVQEKAIL